MKLKDIKTEGYYVYAHITPEKEVYIGISKQQPCKRWKKQLYKGTALEPYIQKYGWQNIKHIVIQDNLMKEDALKIEDALIQASKENGNCINQQRSGLIASDKNAYMKQYYAENEEYREKRNAYNKQHNKQYYSEHKEEIKQYEKQRRTTPEGKIYNRVHNFNRYYPDKAIETPLEAKQKYLETGYIPSYIKNSDLLHP